MTLLDDPIRKKEVAATPEELVRQRVILEMLGPLRYPKGLLAVEKELSELVSISVPARRIDLLCFGKDKEGLFPLLLIECKAEAALSEEKALEQLLGYNQWVKAPFLAVAFPDRVKTLWKEGKELRYIPFLPTYLQLLDAMHSPRP